MGMSARTLREQVKQRFSQPLLILLVAAAFVLLIACANVANLLLVRSERRQREVGVRAALGAARGRLAGQFLTESLLLSALGGLSGIVVAAIGVRALVVVFGSAVPRAGERHSGASRIARPTDRGTAVGIACARSSSRFVPHSAVQ
jgi:ABC-type antimicrobial peptide transport system permease subunit